MTPTSSPYAQNPGYRQEYPSYYPPSQSNYDQPQSGYEPPQPGYNPPQSGYEPPQPGYNPPQQGYYPPQQGYVPPTPGYGPQQGYYPPQQGYVPPQYGPPQGVNVTVVNNAQRSNTPLVVEIILSIFGIFGVGWLTAGETTVGIVLLLCSFFVYWPTLVVVGLFSVGICDLPLVIAAIVVNAILLNNKLKAKAIAYVTMIQGR